MTKRYRVRRALRRAAILFIVGHPAACQLQVLRSHLPQWEIVLFKIRRSEFVLGDFQMTGSGIVQICFALAVAIFVSAFLTDARAYSADQQQACTGDAFRLCGSDIPDVDRVTACMIRQQAQLSPGCRVFFRSPEPAAMPVTVRSSHRARKPVRARPHHKRKPHHAR